MANNVKLNSIFLNAKKRKQNSTQTAKAANDAARRKVFYFNIFLKSDLFGSLIEDSTPISESSEEAENDLEEGENLLKLKQQQQQQHQQTTDLRSSSLNNLLSLPSNQKVGNYHGIDSENQLGICAKRQLLQ